MEDLYAQKLESRGIKPTAVRLLIFRSMTEYPQAFSLSNLEDILETVDKSTLYRTITLFHKKHLIHSIDDGSGATKYSVCSSDCMCTIKDLHAHFFCLHCKKTFCMKTVPIPSIKIEEDFMLSSINFVLKGLCRECNQKIHT